MKRVLLSTVLSFAVFVSHAQTVSDTAGDEHLNLHHEGRVVTIEYKRDRVRERLIMLYINLTRMLTLHQPLIDIGTPEKQKAAYLHSLDMAKRQYCSHEGFGYRSKKYNFLAENAAYGYKSAFGFYRGWLTSKGHRENMLSWRYFFSGIGLCKRIIIIENYDMKGNLKNRTRNVEIYATQVFK